MNLARRQWFGSAVYRWALLGLMAVFAVGMAFPVGAAVAPDGPVARHLLTTVNCRAVLRQALPSLWIDLGGQEVSPGATDVATERPHGLVAWLFGALTGVSLVEPRTFLMANLPLARTSYASVIVASGRPAETAAGETEPGGTPEVTTGGGPPSGFPAARPGEAPATGGAAGVPEDAVLEDGAARLCLYGGKDPIVAVVHSHGSESFLPVVEALAPANGTEGDTATLEAFSPDPSANMIRVGEELARYLADTCGVPAVQSRQLHDAKADGFRLGAYERSLESMTEILRRHPTVKIMIDLHRDAPGHDTTTTVIDGVSTATVCAIVGTDRLLENPRWRSNYDFARRLVATMEQRYPGLSRGILVRDERYNQHVMGRTVLLEVGGQENTFEEVFAAVHDLGDVLAQIVTEGFD